MSRNLLNNIFKQCQSVFCLVSLKCKVMNDTVSKTTPTWHKQMKYRVIQHFNAVTEISFVFLATITAFVIILFLEMLFIACENLDSLIFSCSASVIFLLILSNQISFFNYSVIFYILRYSCRQQHVSFHSIFHQILYTI